MKRHLVVLAAALMCAACAAGPSTRPTVAVDRHSAGSPPGSSATAPAAPAAPPIAVPRNDLAWTDCTARTVAQMHLGPLPAGVGFGCASIAVDIDPDAPDTPLTLDVTRAQSTSAPPGAAPLVLTAGTESTATAQLVALATGPRSSLLHAHPVVAVDRRAISGSAQLHCLSPGQRSRLTDLDTVDGTPTTQANAVLAASTDATVACTDMLTPLPQAFDAGHAADDLESLRRHWGTDTLAILASGDGAQVALAFAAHHPGELSRLILDSPPPTGADAVTAAEQSAQGAEAALTAFTNACLAHNCPLGADPRAAVSDLLDRANHGQLAGVSAGALLAAITDALADPATPWQTRVDGLAATLSALRSGDAATARTVGATTVMDDGQFVARCSDAPAAPASEQIAALLPGWSSRYPVFGANGALGALRCAAWPAHPASALPTRSLIPTLVLGAAADPLVGGGGAAATRTALTRVGTPTATVTWQGAGHPALWNSDCVASIVDRYLASGSLPADDTACPA